MTFKRSSSARTSSKQGKPRHYCRGFSYAFIDVIILSNRAYAVRANVGKKPRHDAGAFSFGVFQNGTKTAPERKRKTVKALRKAFLVGGDEENRTPIRITTRGQNVRERRTFHAIASDPYARCGHNGTKNGTKKILLFFACGASFI